jgi:Terminase large subunit, ATPase domain
MARPSKTLQERVRDRSFVASRHGGLLAGRLVGPEHLQEIQRRWQQEDSETLRRALQVEYEKRLSSGSVLEAAESRSKRLNGTSEGFGLPVARFFPAMFSHVKGPAAGQPFTLEPWQRRFVEEFSRANGGSERIYKRGLLGVARGNGKSPLASGLALRELVARSDEPDVILAAAARDQARVVFEYARGFVESGPLADVLQVGRHEMRNPFNGGVLRTVSADGFVAHGLNPSAVIIDELHAWNSAKQHELFDALDTAVHKRPGAFWLVITTAGHEKLSLLGRLYANMLASLELEEKPGFVVGRDEFNGVLMHWYGAEEDADVDDRKLWRAVNPASFVTIDALRKQRNSPSMSRATFARLHLNAWVAPDVERWIPTDTWDRLAGRVEIPGGSTVFVGADGSRAYDTTAIAWAAKGPDGASTWTAVCSACVRTCRTTSSTAAERSTSATWKASSSSSRHASTCRKCGSIRGSWSARWKCWPLACRARRSRRSSPTAVFTGRRLPRSSGPSSRERFATLAIRPSRSRYWPPLAIVGTTVTCAG